MQFYTSTKASRFVLISLSFLSGFQVIQQHTFQKTVRQYYEKNSQAVHICTHTEYAFI